MSVMIMVTDSQGVSAFIHAGSVPAGSGADTTSATQLQGWLAKKEIHRVLLKLTRKFEDPDIWISPKHVRTAQPLTAERGDSVYEKSGDLCFYAGKRDPKAGNLMMALSKFPSSLAPRRRGKGVIKLSVAGGLAKGNLTWDLVAVNRDGVERIGNFDKLVPKAMGAGAKPTF